MRQTTNINMTTNEWIFVTLLAGLIIIPLIIYLLPRLFAPSGPSVEEQALKILDTFAQEAFANSYNIICSDTFMELSHNRWHNWSPPNDIFEKTTELLKKFAIISKTPNPNSLLNLKIKQIRSVDGLPFSLWLQASINWENNFETKTAKTAIFISNP